MGNPFVHVELNTSDLDKAKKFYKGLFDWKLSDMPMGNGQTYTMLDVGKNEGGGVGGGLQKHPMAGAPSSWLTYVAVDDVKKTIAKAKQLGGQIVEEYIPIPGMGAMGIFVDPTGAALGVWQSERRAQPAAAPAKKKAAPPAKKKKPAPAPAKKKKR
jgi:uncharacterized protein